MLLGCEKTLRGPGWENNDVPEVIVCMRRAAPSFARDRGKQSSHNCLTCAMGRTRGMSSAWEAVIQLSAHGSRTRDWPASPERTYAVQQLWVVCCIQAKG